MSRSSESLSPPPLRQVHAWHVAKEKGASCGLQDTKGVVGKLEIIFALLVHALACLAYLAIFNVSIRRT